MDWKSGANTERYSDFAGQFSAVGLAMTAKSVARYNEISENPSFAEYYLIGTLYSILYTVALYCLLFRFLTVIP